MPSTTATTKKTTAATLVAVAACSMALVAGSNEIQLTPAGAFRSLDGRPVDGSGSRQPDWYIDAALARAVIDKAAARVTPFVIDYDHQTLRAKDNGQPAPAAGWFHKLEWREGVGLFAVDVKWTEPASTMVALDQYKFISPVISYDKATGAITGILMAAIVNNPAIDGMDEVLLAAASLQFNTFATASLNQESQMEELLEKLRWMLNLPISSTADDILGELTKLADLIKQGQTETAAASCDLAALIAGQRATIASLSATTPDPAKFVPIETMTSLQGQVAQLSSQLSTINVDTVVKGALAAGRLLPAQEAWAREFGAKDLAALSSYVKNAPPLGLLTGMQSDKTELTDTGTAALSDNQTQLCKAMGLDPKDYLATIQAASAT